MLKVITTVVGLFIAWSNTALAQSIPGGIGLRTGWAISLETLRDWLERVAAFMLTAGVIIAVIVLVVAGIRWMTAGADQTKAGNAKKAFFNALIGILILFAIGTILLTIGAIGSGAFFFW